MKTTDLFRHRSLQPVLRRLNRAGNASYLTKNSFLPLQPACDQAVDVVYTWVNGADPVWRAKFNQYSGQVSEARFAQRYRDHGEILFSLRTLDRFFPQARTVFIVTDDQTFDLETLPDRLRAKIKFVAHCEIFPSDYVAGPIFNSTIIESFLWRIPSLAECFLYFNDDVFLGSPLTNSDIFNSQGVPYTYLLPTVTAPASPGKADEETRVWKAALLNTRNLFVGLCRLEPNLGEPHVACLLRREICETVFELFGKQWREGFFRERLRGEQSVIFNLLASWLGLYLGYQVLYDPQTLRSQVQTFFDLKPENIEAMRIQAPRFFCVNRIEDSERFSQLMGRYLDQPTTPPTTPTIENATVPAPESPSPKSGKLRIVAILAAYNEERFIAACLEHLFQQGVEAYLIDNESTDATAAIAQRYLGQGLLGLESLARGGMMQWGRVLERKEQLATTLPGDWFMHADPDEFRLPPHEFKTLAEAFQAADELGFNAINFLEYTFLPVRESPDHDHPNFQETLRWFYPFVPSFPYQLKAWKRQPVPVQLVWSGGHQVYFPGLRLYPLSFPLRHYQILSVPHVLEKYGQRIFAPEEVKKGWHGWRTQLATTDVELPSQAELRYYGSDADLTLQGARRTHYLADALKKSATLETQSEPNINKLLETPPNQNPVLLDLQRQVAALEGRLKDTQYMLEVATHEVETLHHARFYKMMTLYWAMRDAVQRFWPGSGPTR